MQATFTLTRKDVLAYYRLLAHRLTMQARARPRLLVANLLAWIPVGFAVASFVALYRKYPGISDDLNVVAIATAVGIAALVASIRYQRHLYRRAALPLDSPLLVPQSFEATPQFIEIQRPGTTSRFDWSCFVDCVEHGSNLHLFLDSSHAVILPKAAFSSPAELEQFRAWFKAGAKRAP